VTTAQARTQESPQSMSERFTLGALRIREQLELDNEHNAAQIYATAFKTGLVHAHHAIQLLKYKDGDEVVKMLLRTGVVDDEIAAKNIASMMI
jgi:hypothetical protein